MPVASAMDARVTLRRARPRHAEAVVLGAEGAVLVLVLSGAVHGRFQGSARSPCTSLLFEHRLRLSTARPWTGR
jgi:hypothetical protein